MANDSEYFIWVNKMTLDSFPIIQLKIIQNFFFLHQRDPDSDRNLPSSSKEKQKASKCNLEV